MQKFIPIALFAILVVGCKGGDTTAATGGGAGSSVVKPSSDGSYTLKFNPKEGEKYTYVTQTSATGMDLEQTMTMFCEKVDGDNRTIITTIDAMKMNGNEPPAAAADSLKKMKIITTMDSSGKTLETKMEGAPAGMPAPDSPVAAFPTKAVKVGDTWDGSLKMGGTDVKANYKLTSVEGGTATIESMMEGLPMGMTMESPAITKIDLSTGMPISTSSKMKMKGPDGKDAEITSEMKRK